MITKDGQTLQKVPAAKVEQVVVFGNVNLTTPVIAHLLQQGIDCVFCSSYGKYHGRLFSTESGYGLLRQKQALVASNQEARLAIARETVRGKLLNQRTLLMRYRRDHPLDELDRAVAGVDECLRDLDRATDVGQLHGQEGVATAMYFRAFKAVLKQELGFETRVRRPPTDPVNSLLSFGYTLLTYSMQSAIRIVGLDPFIGFLHTVEYSRPSLALDLIEEFRAIVVDSIVLRCINTRSLTAEDFRRSEEDPRAIVLTQEGMKKFLGMYEERVQTRINHPVTGQQVTYRRCFELQARQMARVIKGEAPRYQPFLVK